MQQSLVATQIESAEGQLEKYHVSLLKNRVNMLLEENIYHFDQAFDLLRLNLRQFQLMGEDAEKLSSDRKESINRMLFYLDHYTSDMKKLAKMGYAIEGSKKVVTTEEFYDSKIDFKRLKRVNFQEYFRIKRTESVD